MRIIIEEDYFREVIDLNHPVFSQSGKLYLLDLECQIERITLQIKRVLIIEQVRRELNS